MEHSFTSPPQRRESNFCVIWTTCKDSDVVTKLAEALITRRAAACVQVDEIQSYYRWQGKTEVAKEYRLAIKTNLAATEMVKEIVAEISTYECPQMIVTPITDGSADYLSWMSQQIG